MSSNKPLKRKVAEESRFVSAGYRSSLAGCWKREWCRLFFVVFFCARCHFIPVTIMNIKSSCEWTTIVAVQLKPGGKTTAFPIKTHFYWQVSTVWKQPFLQTFMVDLKAYSRSKIWQKLTCLCEILTNILTTVIASTHTYDQKKHKNNLHSPPIKGLVSQMAGVCTPASYSHSTRELYSNQPLNTAAKQH